MKVARLAYLAGAVVLTAVLSIVSSCSSNPASILIGTWRQDVTYSNVPSGDPSTFRFQFQFNKDNTIELDTYVFDSTQNAWVLFTGNKGTYTVSGDIITMVISEQYGPLTSLSTPSSWSSVSPQTGTAQYNCSGTMLVLTEDLNQDGKYDTSHLIQNTYPGGSGTPTDITFELPKV